MERQLQKSFTNSTNVKEIKYSQERMIMQVTFTSGSTYQYFDVPTEVWDRALKAPSIGSFINSEIKGVYKYSQV